MKKIKINDKVCFNCGQCTQYYEKGFHNFYTIGFGFCNAKNELVKENNTCNCFNKRERKRVTAEEVKNAISKVKKLKILLK